MNFRYRLMQFMTGRYGPDRLFYILFAIAAALSIINIFVGKIVIQIIVYALIIYAIFRMFSKNKSQRIKENEFVFKISDYFKRKKELSEKRKSDRCHVYKKCPSCGAILRLPRRVGTHKTVCPRCNFEFTVKVRK